MLIRIINGTYGHRPRLPNGEMSPYVVPTTPSDPPIDVDEEKAKELVKANVAVYASIEPVATVAAIPEAPTPEALTPNGTLGEESGTEEQEEGESEQMPVEEDAPLYNADMKADELRAAMKELGLPMHAGMSKVEMAEALNAAEAKEAPPAPVVSDVVE